MRKWVKICIVYNDGSRVEWTPEDLEKVKVIAKEIVEMLLRSAKKEVKE